MKGFSLKTVFQFLYLNLLSFLFYLLAGRFSLLLSSQDGYSTPVWPPAGISLALTLIFGKRTWIGIFLGAFFTNTDLHFFQRPNLNYILQNYQNIIIALGNSGQAVLGAYLLRRTGNFPNTLSQLKEIFYFFFYGGAVSCLLASSVGILSLYIKGFLNIDNLLFSWSIWWSGDLTGIVIFTPILLFLYYGFNKQVKVLRSFIVSSSLFFVFMIAVIVFFFAKSWETDVLQTRLNYYTANLANSLKVSIKENIHSLKSLSTYIRLQKELNRDSFEAFSKVLISNSNSVVAVSWNLYMSQSERQKVELELFKNYKQRYIKSKDRNGKLLRSEKKTTYVTVFYIYPLIGNENAIGYDVYSENERRIALDKAIQKRKETITDRIQLVQDKDSSYGFLIFDPVFIEDKIIGFSTAIIKIPILVKKSLNNLSNTPVCFQMIESHNTQEERILYESECWNKADLAKVSFRTEKSISVKDKKWLLKVATEESYFQHYKTKAPWLILLLACHFTGLLGILILVITGKEEATQIIVEKTTEKLKKANEVKSDFMANMSHEIRTPLGAIIGFNYLLQEKSQSLEVPEEFVKYLQIIENSSKLLLELVNNVLEISKIEAGKYSIVKSEFSVGELIKSIYDSYSYQASKKGIIFTYEMEEGIESLRTDRTRLMQILINILGNAIKFTPTGKAIQIKVSLKNNILQFSIIDQGIGIPEEKLGEIFHPFTQAEETTAIVYGGSGLGLSISKKLAELLGGKITVKSKVTEGSTFTLELPYNREYASRRKGNENIPLELKLNPNSLIVVFEDNKLNQILLFGFLELIGLTAVFAENGKEGIELIQKLLEEDKKPDIIFMDMQMPIMGGLEATEFIRKKMGLKDLPIIALSADAFSEQKEKALKSGLNDYMTKPIEIKTLKSILYKYLSK